MSILFLTIFLANHESAFARGYSESLREQAAGRCGHPPSPSRLRPAVVGLRRGRRIDTNGEETCPRITRINANEKVTSDLCILTSKSLNRGSHRFLGSGRRRDLWQDKNQQK